MVSTLALLNYVEVYAYFLRFCSWDDCLTAKGALFMKIIEGLSFFSAVLWTLG